MRKFWKVYKEWIARQKIIRAEEEATKEVEVEEDEDVIRQKEEEELELQREKEAKLKKMQADEVQQVYEVKKCEFLLNEDDDIFSVTDGVDLSKFKANAKTNSDDYDTKLKEIKEDKKKIKKQSKNHKLAEIPEEVDESIVLSPFHTKVGKVLAAKIEIAWEKKQQRREGKKLSQLLKYRPPQCRNSYVKLMQLRRETADLQADGTKMPSRLF